MSETAVLAQRPAGNESPAAGNILIIDDEAAIRESLQTLLEMEGYRVEASESGEDGLARIAEHPYELVLLDFALPGLNGIDVLQEIRELHPRLRVVIVTAYGTAEQAA